MDIKEAIKKEIKSLNITAIIDGDGDIEVSLLYEDETISTCYVPLTRFVEKVIEDNTHVWEGCPR